MNTTSSPVEHILQEMMFLYGKRFEQQWGNQVFPDMVAYWQKKLSGFSRDELARGYKALETLKYPPTLPEFMQLCRPPVEPVKAYHEAVKGVQDRRNGEMGQWSHPAIFWTAASMTYELLNNSYQQVKPHFEKRLEEELSRTSWQEIPPVSESLPALKVDRENGKAEAEKMLQRVGADKVLKKTANGDTNWIHNNLKRMKEGWKPTAAVRMMILKAAKEKGIAIA